MRIAAKIIVAGVSTVALAGGIGAGLAYADPTEKPAPTPTASGSPSAEPQEKDRARARRGLLGTALHGEVTLAGPDHRVVVFQRGPIQTISPTSVTVQSADGYTASYTLGEATRVRKNREKAAVTDLEAGDRILVIAAKDGDTLSALRVKAMD